MSPQTNPIETALKTLGQAHREGAFSAAPGRYPWQAVESESGRLARRPLAWVRVGAPLAAAAAVAVLFVIPGLLEKPAVERVASNVPSVETPEQPEAVAEVSQLAMTTPTGEVNCDFNGDGRIDGRDIQAYLDRVRDAGGDSSEEDLALLRQCLLQ